MAAYKRTRTSKSAKHKVSTKVSTAKEMYTYASYGNCDMILPICSLCQRTGTSCVYPLRRKPRAPRVARANRSDTPSQDANLKHWTPQQNVFADVRSWNPQYIGLHNPFMACLVVGPAAINLRVALDSKKEDAASSLTGLEVDLLILALKRVARFWNFSSILLGSIVLAILSSIVRWRRRKLLDNSGKGARCPGDHRRLGDPL
ncbi:hypothetical protein EMGR_007021 [Emarellia grisea]